MPFSLMVDRTIDTAGQSVSARDLVADLARDLLDGGAATCVTDSRGELIYANAAYERIAIAAAAAGLAPIGRPIETRASGTAPEPTRRQAIEVEGKIAHYEIREQILRDAAGAITGRSVVYSPIVKPDNAKTTLAAAIERLEDITRLVSDWVWETDRDSVLTYLSPRVQEVLGYHPLQLTRAALGGTSDRTQRGCRGALGQFGTSAVPRPGDRDHRQRRRNPSRSIERITDLLPDQRGFPRLSRHRPRHQRTAAARGSAASGQGGGRVREPHQIRVPGLHEPRAAHATQRNHRLFGDHGRRDARAARQCPVQGLCGRHIRQRPSPARADQTTFSMPPRSRPGRCS